MGRRLTPDISFFVRKKADSLFKCVSAASIVAKVTRDRALLHWQFRERGPGGAALSTKKIGCGYPSDPKTKAWLREHLDANCGLPEIVRFSWKTTSNLMKERNCEVQSKSMLRNLSLAEYDALGLKRAFLSRNDFVKGGLTRQARHQNPGQPHSGVQDHRGRPQNEDPGH